MEALDHLIRRRGYFLRRRDILPLGYTDGSLRYALRMRCIFRVRHGWYSVPDAPKAAVEAVRVGGRLTGIAALESFGVPVPRRPTICIAVPRKAVRLRSTLDRRRRLSSSEQVCIHWVDAPRSVLGPQWRMGVDDALTVVLGHETRDVAVACASAVMRRQRWSQSRLEHAFAKAPKRAQSWLPLVSALDDSHGETFFRLWTRDRGMSCEQQVAVPGAGTYDFRMSPNVYVEIDGAQHDPEWTGEGESSYERDHDRDRIVATNGGTVFRITYRMLYGQWPECVVAIERLVSDDRELIARRRRHPGLPRALARDRAAPPAKPLTRVIRI